MLGSGLFHEVHAAGVTGSVTGSRSELVVIRDGGLGDVLMALPPAQEFARRHPEIRVSFATAARFVELIAAQGFERVYPLDAIPADADRIDLRWYVERHKAQRDTPRQALFADPFGMEATPDQVAGWRRRLTVKAEWLQVARQRLQVVNRETMPLVVMAARASSAQRSVDPAVLASIVNGLLALGCRVVLTDEDHVVLSGYPGAFPIWGLTLAQLAGLVSLADLVVSPDTGTLHLAAHIGIPVVATFTTWPARLRMQGYDGIAIEPEGLLCFPCHDRGCPPHWCGVMIDPDQVIAAARRILSRKFRLARTCQGDASSEGHIEFGKV
jgi:ADP-heptose:LPS heptosyltransferase